MYKKILNKILNLFSASRVATASPFDCFIIRTNEAVGGLVYQSFFSAREAEKMCKILVERCRRLH
jgi:hypothetical protein